MSATLPTSFYQRPAPQVARELLGACLCRRLGDHIVRMPLTEVEAYDGTGDLACHASKGRTARTEVLFGPPGRWYVYLCYGVHWMLNVVVGPENYPAAVLIRGTRDVTGPGRLTRQLQIDRDLNRTACHPDSGLWIEAGELVADVAVQTTPRIGINYAPEPWLSMPWRFVWAAD